MSSIGKISAAYVSGRDYFLAKKAMNSTMGKEFPKKIQFLKEMSKRQDEAFNIIVNAIGTAFVAPIFIAYNPLSKTDENTKKYSALRQPVSAVLAVATQVGLVIPWNRFVDWATNNGKFGQYYSQQAAQGAGYLRRQAKRLNPHATKKEIDAIVEAKQTDQFAKLYEEFATTGKMTVGSQPLPEKTVRELISETASNLIKNADKENQRYHGEQYQCHKQRAQFLFENKDSVPKKLAELRDGLASKGSKEDVEKYLKERISSAKKSGAVDEWIKILRDDLLPKGDKESVLKKIASIERQTSEYAKHNSFGTILEDLQKIVDKKDANLKQQKSVYEAIQKAADGNMPMDKVRELLNNKTIKEDKIVAKVVDNYITKITRRMSGFKAVSGLCVSLAIMPVTCCLLNYLYPIFMDKCFPSLSKPKKEGGNNVCHK